MKLQYSSNEIREAMEIAGERPEQLVNRIKCSFASLSNYINGRGVPKNQDYIDRLNKYCKKHLEG